MVSKSVQRVGGWNASSFQYDENTFIRNVVKKYFASKTRDILQYITVYFDENVTLSQDPDLNHQISVAEREFEKCYEVLQIMEWGNASLGFITRLKRFKEFFIDRRI